MPVSGRIPEAVFHTLLFYQLPSGMEMAMFDLGITVATPAAVKFCEEHNVDAANLLHRHAAGVGDDLAEEDVKANRDAVAFGARIFSSYKFGLERVWVITEADRSSTSVLLPSDY